MQSEDHGCFWKLQQSWLDLLILITCFASFKFFTGDDWLFTSSYLSINWAHWNLVHLYFACTATKFSFFVAYLVKFLCLSVLSRCILFSVYAVRDFYFHTTTSPIPNWKKKKSGYWFYRITEMYVNSLDSNKSKWHHGEENNV